MKQWGKQQSAAQTGSFLAPAGAPADRSEDAGEVLDSSLDRHGASPGRPFPVVECNILFAVVEMKFGITGHEANNAG
jgi:hypothetical protein